MTDKILLRVLYQDGTGEPLDLPVFNTFCGGISGHGKTELIKAYVNELHKEQPDLKILVVDSTDDQEYRDLGVQVPICFVDTTEPFILKELLSSVSGVWMERYIGEIIDELSVTDSLQKGLEGMEEKLQLAKKAGRDRKNENWLHPRERKNILIVATALRKLLELAKRMGVVDRLDLSPGINRMNLSLKGVDVNLKLGFQQLIIRSVALKIVNEHRNVFLVLDEGQKWIPQRYSSGAKQAVSDLLGEGRKLGDSTFLAAQTMAKIDKEPLYNVRYYVMGLQTHPNEIKRTLEILGDVLEETPIKAKDIKGLEDGWFWVLTKRTVQKAYAKPWFMDEPLAVQVAQHNTSSTAAWKSALEELQKRRVVPVKKEVSLNRQEIRNLILETFGPDIERLAKTTEDTAEEAKAIKRTLDDFDGRFLNIGAKLQGILEKGLKEGLNMEPSPEDRTEFERLIKSAISPEAIRIVVQEELNKTGHSTTQAPSSVIHVDVEKPIAELHVRKPLLLASDKALQGRLLYAISKGAFDQRQTAAKAGDILSGFGWIHDKKEIDVGLLGLCDLKFFTRRISTGNLMWYSLEKDAKERIILMEEKTAP